MVATALNGPLSPPPAVHVDREQFKTSLRVRAIRVPTRETDAVLKALRGFALDLPRVKAVTRDAEGERDGNLILLNDKVVDDDLRAVIPEERLSVVRERVGGEIEVTEYDVPLTYEYFNAAQVLEEIVTFGGGGAELVRDGRARRAHEFEG